VTQVHQVSVAFASKDRYRHSTMLLLLLAGILFPCMHCKQQLVCMVIQTHCRRAPPLAAVCTHWLVVWQQILHIHHAQPPSSTPHHRPPLGAACCPRAAQQRRLGGAHDASRVVSQRRQDASTAMAGAGRPRLLQQLAWSQRAVDTAVCSSWPKAWPLPATAWQW
jgi:hypothetical protein